MSSIGAELPPHLLAKRKRKQEQEEQEKRPQDNIVKQNGQQSTSDATTSISTVVTKKPRVMGPAMPPAELSERPLEPATADEDSSDDDFGPSLPSAEHDRVRDKSGAKNETDTREVALETTPANQQRDEWMMMAPKQDDLAARMDPGRIRARGFNTGRNVKAGGNEDTSIWHESVEQKQKRLADEVLGISASKPSPLGDQRRSGPASKISKADNDDSASSNSLREKNKESRGPSLLERHQQQQPEQAEDDPSKRAFDREKDMSTAGIFGGAKKREMLNKASDYSSRFSKATQL